MIFSLVAFCPFVFNPKYLLITISILGLIFLSLFLRKQNNTYSSINGQYKIYKVTSMGPLIKEGKINILLATKGHFSVNDIIKIYGSPKLIENTTEFDKVTYFKTLNVFYEIKFAKPELLSHSTDIRNTFDSFVQNGPINYKKVSPLVLLGIKNDFTKEIYQTSVSMNVVHLFVISGFHISIFYIGLKKLLSYIKVKENVSSLIALALIFIYLFFLRFPLSASRAGLLVLFSFINKTFLKKKFNSIELLGFVMAIFISWNPYSIYSLSFVLTFLATFVILLVNEFKFKRAWVKNSMIVICAFLSNILIIVWMNHTFSIFGFLYGIILTPLFSFIYVITLVLFWQKDIMNIIDQVFIFTLNSFDQTNIRINIPSFDLSFTLLFYLVLTTCFIIFMIWNLFEEKKVT